MNWDQVNDTWKQVASKAKRMWGNPTDDEPDVIEVEREVLVSTLQAKYGLTREQSEEQVNDWVSKSRSWLRGSVKQIVPAETSLDKGTTTSTVEVERSSATTERQERIGVDSSKRAPVGVHSPLEGRVAERPSGQGEEGMHPDSAYFAQVRKILGEYHESVTPEQFLEDVRRAVAPRTPLYDDLIKAEQEQTSTDKNCSK